MHLKLQKKIILVLNLVKKKTNKKKPLQNKQITGLQGNTEEPTRNRTEQYFNTADS